MALVCSSCGTENRLAAKFCIECVAPLPVVFAPTQQMPLRGAAAPAAADTLPSALAAFASGPPSTPSAPTAFAPREEVPEPAPPRRRMLTHFLLLVAGFSLAAAAGWIVASSDGDAEAAPVAATPQEPPAPAPIPVAAASEAPARTEAPAGDAAVAHPAAPPVEQPVAPPATPPATPAMPPSRPAPAVVSPAPAARTAAARSKPTATPEVHAPTRQAGLLDACEPLGFITRERCKVDLCSKAANQRRAECAPVLAQQRLIQEKINPQLAN